MDQMNSQELRQQLIESTSQTEDAFDELKRITIIKNKERISDIKQEMSSMEEIFELQEMFEIKNQEKSIEKDLKKMGYVDG